MDKALVPPGGDPKSKVTHIRQQGQLIFKLSGEVTTRTVLYVTRYVEDNLKRFVNDQGIWFDLTEVSYLDSGGLSMFFTLNNKLKREKRVLGLINPVGPVKQTLQAARVEMMLPVCPDMATAVVEARKRTVAA